MDLHALLIEPFSYGFMRRALVAVLALALAAAPVGVFLLLRRLSLIGDALGHSILPGVAIAFLIAGLSLPAMTIGGLLAGIVVVLLAGFVARTTHLREDASLAAFYLTSIAFGVLVIAQSGSNVDVMHVLFGSILSVDDQGLILIAGIASLTVVALAVLYRPLVVESFDPAFLRATGGPSAFVHFAFLMLVVLNLIAGFQALGTLMAVGLVILPAAAARFWAEQVWTMIAAASGIAFSSGVIGLLASYHLDWPSGPTIVLVAGIVYAVSVVAGRIGGLIRHLLPPPHVHEPGPLHPAHGHAHGHAHSHPHPHKTTEHST